MLQSFVPSERGSELDLFQSEVREFVQARLPRETRDKVCSGRALEKADHVEWQKMLVEKNWYVGHWPKAYGGLDWSPMQRWIFENTLYSHGSPWLIPFGISFVAPVIYTFGTDEQKQRFLPAIRNSEAWWCQGYSEAGAGSDLANVATRAVRDGDEWVISGSKIWTTTAHWADMMFAIVRTSAGSRPQLGLSFVLIDLSVPGVTIRPIRTIDGHHHVNEVLLDEVRIPAGNLIGEEGKGWSHTKFLLDRERMLGAEVGRCSRELERARQLVGLADEGCPDGHRLHWAKRIASLEMRLVALESLAFDVLATHASGNSAGATPSMLKLIGSELSQDIDSAALDAISDTRLRPTDSAAFNALSQGVLDQYLYGRAATIYGGSSEIQRNILSRAILEQ